MGTPRILVADDDPWILKMVTSVLKERGYAVITAEDGEAAYERAIADPPDLVIADVMMPKVDGWALVRALRSRPEFAFVPVIFLTALASDDDRIRGFRLGADDYVAKPFRFEELDLRVARTLRSRERLEATAREQVEGGGDPEAETASAAGGAGLSGDLEAIGLPSVLTLLELEQKTGELTLRADEREAAVLIRRGRVVAARLRDREAPRGAECVYELLTWPSGAFAFEARDVETEDEIEVPTTHLLIEGARRLDEANRLM